MTAAAVLNEIIDPTGECSWSPDDEDACPFCSGEACYPCGPWPRNCEHASDERHKGAGLGSGAGIDAGSAVGAGTGIGAWWFDSDLFSRRRGLAQALIGEGWRPFRTESGTDVLVSPATGGRRGRIHLDRYPQWICVLTVGPALARCRIGPEGSWRAVFERLVPDEAILAAARAALAPPGD